MRRMKVHGVRGALAMLVGSAGCAGADDVGTGTAVLAIQTVPGDVGCLRFTVSPAGAPTQTLDRAVSGGGSTQVSLGALPSGGVTISGEAFAGACAGVTASSTPTWISAPQTWTIRAGYLNELDMVFRPNQVVTARADFISPARAIATGERNLYVLTEDGRIRSFGNNFFGQLGNFAVANGARLGGGIGARAVAVTGGNHHACALASTGEAWCWGENTSGELGFGTTSMIEAPQPVNGELRFSQIEAGYQHTCAVEGGSNLLYCWGLPSTFLLPGAARTTALSVGTQAGLLSSGGRGTCVQTNLGALCCGGENTSGELGVGSIGPVNFNPLIASRFPIPAALDVGLRHSCVVDLTGALRCAGYNGRGQLGNGTSGEYSESVPVAAALTGVARVTVGGLFTCALKTDGTVWCWGDNAFGQLGAAASSGAALSTAARQVTGLTDVIQVSAGNQFACALKRDGAVWCWGRNEEAQLGDGTYITRHVPVRVVL